MKLFTKEELIEKIIAISQQGWHPSVKSTIDKRNDGAVGNTLEELIGITENNLPLPNAGDWELKGQRENSSSLITLKHIEPSPQGAHIVSNLLLPFYGWPHKKAGTKYPASEMSFRSTTSATAFTSRGFKIIVDRDEEKIKFIFDSSQVDTNDDEINNWLQSVRSRIGLGPLYPQPYWGFNDLKYKIGEKIRNCFYVTAESKVENKHEYFRYCSLKVVSEFSFDKFLDSVERSSLLIDFDARTHHNHGTKFRLKQNFWSELYENVESITLNF